MVNEADPTPQKRRELQEAMSFLAALASGMEQLVGRGAAGMSFTAGRTLGKQFAEKASKTADLLEALGEVRRVLAANDCLWGFEPFQPKAQAELVVTSADGTPELMLVFRDCMIRQALFRFGHAQQGSLCSMMYGFFSGALEAITGRKAELEIVHAGENACLKRLRLRGAAPVEGKGGAA
jgi:predicted hydrocarbon binding protein